MASLRATAGLFLSLACLSASAGYAAAADPQFKIGATIIGDLKYQPGFTHFDYANPDAPKGGDVKLGADGTFDTFNPILQKGAPADGVASLVFDTLLKHSNDETASAYGLLAEGVAVPDDISSATFRLRPEAKWADGTPVTPDDVIFSFDSIKALNPLYTAYYSHVVKAEKSGDRDVTFTFDEKGNRELPMILGEFPIIPKAWWEGKGPDGKPRDISRTTLEPVMGSGPYKIASFSAGATIRYERRTDYWGKDLPVNAGQNNFDSITYNYFGDRDVAFEAFRSGNIDYWSDNQASRWATGYDFPAVKDGRIKKVELPNPLRASGVMQALVPNMRRDQFKDERVREALNYAFDFEEMNRNIFFNAYKRVDSFFFGTELASSGLPQGAELDLLNGVKDKVPPSVFTTPYTNPVGGDPQKSRDNLRHAIELLKQAGYVLKGNQMVDSKTGKPFSFEILLNSSILERVALPYAQSLKKIGIDARVRTVDTSQYINRVQNFDYDMIWYVWGETLSPGNEQLDFWGSAAANRKGSHNFAGIMDPAIDALIPKVIFAGDLAQKTASVKALDRVLLAGHYVIPMYYTTHYNIAYWDKFDHLPELPKYAIGFPDVWWSKQVAK